MAGRGTHASQTLAGDRRLGLVLALVILVLDQASKWWVVNQVMAPPRIIPVTSFFNLVMGWNRGISFGFFNTDSPVTAWVMPLLAIAIIAVLAVWLWRDARSVVAVGIGLVMGGAAGNVVDRLRFGAVADFLDFHAFGYHWPAFNVADASITLGAAILVFESLFAGGDRRRYKGGTSDKSDNEP